MPTGGTANVEARQNRITSLFLAREKVQGPTTFSLVRYSGNRTETRRNARMLTLRFVLGGMITIPRRTS